MVKGMPPRRFASGFTLIELLIVLAIIATLLALVAPRYFHSVDKAQEAALRANLHVMRDAIDKHYADTGRYPDDLATLVNKRYLRSVPVDPITGSDQTWTIVTHPDSTTPGVYDIHSGAEGLDQSGKRFAEL